MNHLTTPFFTWGGSIRERKKKKEIKRQRGQLSLKRTRQDTHAELLELKSEFIALLEAITNCLTWHKFTQSSPDKSLITILAVNQIRLKGH